MQFRRITMPLMLAATVLLSMGVANATLQMTISSGLATQTVSTAACPGPACMVSFIGAVGAWNLNITGGLGSGSLVGPILDVSSIDNTMTGGPDLVIRLAEDGLSAASAAGPFNGVIDGNGTISSILYQAFWGTALGTTPNLIGSTGTLTNPVPGANFSYHGALSGSGGGNTLALVLTLHSPNPGSTSFDAGLTPVPEPAAVALLGGLLLFTGSSIRRIAGKRT